MALIYLRDDAAREVAALVASINPPRTPGDVILACARLGAFRRDALESELAAIVPLPAKGTGRRAKRGQRKAPACSACGAEGHKATWIACPEHPRRRAAKEPPR